MKTSLIVLACLSIPPAINAKAQLGMRGGVNFCVENNDSHCDQLMPGYSLTIAPGYSSHPNLQFTLDIGLASLVPDAEEAPDINFLHVIPMVKGVINAGVVRLSLGGGLGYSRLKVSSGSVSIESNTWLAFKGAGAVLVPVDDQWDAVVGADFVFNGEMETCRGLLSSSNECRFVDTASQLKLAGGFIYRF